MYFELLQFGGNFEVLAIKTTITVWKLPLIAKSLWFFIMAPCKKKRIPYMDLSETQIRILLSDTYTYVNYMLSVKIIII